MVRSKRDGGLGFRDLQNFNDALLAKISWRILTQPSCLLAKILLRKYCHGKDFLECEAPNTASHGWRGICVAKNLIKPHLGKAIGDGRMTNIWTEPWLSLDQQCRPMGPPTELTKNLQVSRLISPTTGEWNKEEIRAIVPNHEKQILELKPSKKGAQDKIIWQPTKEGIYTAKSGYYEGLRADEEARNVEEDAEMEGVLEQQNRGFNWNVEMWKLHTSQKTKLFMWKAIHEAIPVGENLGVRNVNTSIRCSHCGEAETTTQLLYQCDFAEKVWKLAPCLHPVETSLIPNVRKGFEDTRKIICLPPRGSKWDQSLPG